MAKQKELLFIQHVLEVRLKRRYLRLLDQRGKLLTNLLETLKLNQFRIGDDRIEIVSDNHNIMYFLSTGNFGLQIDNSETFAEFKNEAKKLIDNLKKVKDFNPEILRLGTKSSIFYHQKGKGFDQIRDIFTNVIIPKSSELEKVLGGKQVDIGLPLNFKFNGTNFNTQSGPMRKEQAINEFFRTNPQLYSNLPESGLFFGIDLFQVYPQLIPYTDLEQNVFKNIDNIQNKFEAFKNWFFKGS